MMSLLFGKYTFHCTFTRDATLPEFKGSTFRGVFGRALKQTVCALKHQACDQCLLKEKCLYCVTFETHVLASTKETKQPNRPHPFVIVPPLSPQTSFQKGEAFAFDLLLFGPVNDSLPYFVYALDQMGKIGVGRQVEGERGAFQLGQVRQNNTIIYNAKEGTLKPHAPAVLDVPWDHSASGRDRTITATLLTPLRLKRNNHLHDQLPFHVLIRAMLRRASSLFDWYGRKPPAFDYKGLIEKAEHIETIRSDIRWQDWRRYSSRQKDAMLLGGMTGTIAYRGDVGEFLPLIHFCEQVNIGKQTAFGLGRFSIKII